MQISRFLGALGLVAIALVPISGRAADTDAQTKAREALRSKLGQLDSQSPSTNAAAPSPANPAKPIASSPPAQPEPQPAATPAPATPEPQPQPAAQPAAHPVQTPLPAETVPNRSFAAPAPVRSSQTSQSVSEPAPPRNRGSRKSPPPVIAAPAADPDKIAQAREQMRQKHNTAVSQETPEAT